METTHEDQGAELGLGKVTLQECAAGVGGWAALTQCRSPGGRCSTVVSNTIRPQALRGLSEMSSGGRLNGDRLII